MTTLGPAEEQLLADFDEQLRCAYDQHQALLHDAAAQAEDAIARNPTSPTALRLVLSSMRQRASAIVADVANVWSAHHSERLREITSAGSDYQDPGQVIGERMLREGTHWLNSQWVEFAASWESNQIQAMWPHVDAALQEPALCNECGGLLAEVNSSEPQQIPCSHCGASVLLEPPEVVKSYYEIAPDACAATLAMPLRQKIERLELDWKNERDVILQQTGSWPDKSVELLREIEHMEREYWSYFASVRAQTDPQLAESQHEFVQQCMERVHQSLAEEPNWNPKNTLDVVSEGEARVVSDDLDATVARQQRSVPIDDERAEHPSKDDEPTPASSGRVPDAVLNGPEPVSFDTYASMSGAMNAWAQQGKDVDLMLEQYFQISNTEFTHIGMYWSAKMAGQDAVYTMLVELVDGYEKQWLSQS